jgi:hypothetical protein
MTKIIAGLRSHAQEINQNSTEIVSGGYDIDNAIADIENRFPLSVASKENTEPKQQEI